MMPPSGNENGVEDEMVRGRKCSAPSEQVSFKSESAYQNPAIIDQTKTFKFSDADAEGETFASS